MHKQAIKHKQAIIGGGYLFTENACCNMRFHWKKIGHAYSWKQDFASQISHSMYGV